MRQDLPYWIVVRAARRLMKLGRWEPRVEGAHYIPAQGPAVLAANHISYLDFIFAAWGAVFDRGRYVRFLAKKEVFDAKWSGPLMRSMRHIPVDRKKDPGRAMDAAIKALEQGEVVAAFLEGSVNRTLVPGRGKTGAVRMAQATGAPLIPMALWGTHRIWAEVQGPEERRSHRRHRLTRGTPVIVKIGPPITISPAEDPRDATDRVMDVIRDLLARAQSEDGPGG